MPNIRLLVDTYWMRPFGFGFYSIDKNDSQLLMSTVFDLVLYCDIK